MDYVVSQRRHEMGVRLALGATPRAVFARVVLRRAGAGWRWRHGRPGRCLSARSTDRELALGVEASDALTLTAVPLVIAAIALLACGTGPHCGACRASRRDPKRVKPSVARLRAVASGRISTFPARKSECPTMHDATASRNRFVRKGERKNKVAAAGMLALLLAAAGVYQWPLKVTYELPH